MKAFFVFLDFPDLCFITAKTIVPGLNTPFRISENATFRHYLN